MSSSSSNNRYERINSSNVVDIDNYSGGSSSGSNNTSNNNRNNTDLSKEQLINIISNEDLQAIERLGGIHGVAEKLGSHFDRGLSERDAKCEMRKEKFGENRMSEIAPKSFLFFLWQSVQDKTLIILMISAIVSIVLGLTVEDRKTGWIDGTAILVAVAIVVLVTAGNDYQKELKFRKLNSIRNERNLTVIRDGHQSSISIYDLVVGDVTRLETGEKIPADGLYLNGVDLQVDESSMTGESDSKHKSPNEPFLLSGCQVLQGNCTMLVVAVGESSQWGQLKLILQSPDTDTPLTKKLETLSETIGKFGVIAALLTLLVLIIKFIVSQVTGHIPWQWSQLGTLVGFLVVSISIIVVAVPEGLPLAVTISLAYSMMKMMKDQNLVRHLEACETMGGATNICSDKTGTLTMNRMTLIRKCIGLLKTSNNESDHSLQQLQQQQQQQQQDLMLLHKPHLLELISESISVNSSAYLEKHQDQPLSSHIGSKTECALLEWLDSIPGQSYEACRQRNKSKVVRIYPFNSEKKLSMVLLAHQSAQNNFRILVKGAAEIILDRCQNSIITSDDDNNNADNMDDDNSQRAMSKEEKLLLQKQIEVFASEGLRTLVIAYKEFRNNPEDQNEDDLLEQLTFIALFGIKDPLRPEVPRAVKRCQQAGITVRMLTGDNILTAKNIARECLILKSGGVAMEGPHFRQLTDQQLDSILPHLQVLARCSPQDKFRLVKRLRDTGEVVAVTGDGVNDAPQLKEADVGFAMGITGTEVAKEASDIILLDDNFNSISRAVLWGRNVYDSIRKFIQFQLTVNIVAVAIALVGAITDGESPLRPVQLLWVNLIMDTLGALALATEPPTEKLYLRRPYGRYDSLITYRMWRNIIGQAIYQLAFMFAILYGSKTLHQLFDLPPTSQWSPDDKTVYHTIIFNTFVFCQLFNEINSRVLDNQLNVFQGILRNYIFLGVMLFNVVVQTLLVEFGGDFFGTRHLDYKQWFFCLIIGFGTLIWGLCLRLLPIKDKDPTLGVAQMNLKMALSNVDLEKLPIDVESTPLLQRGSKWKTAQNVFTEISVISAFRNQPRLKRTKSLLLSQSPENLKHLKNKSSSTAKQ
ncbi:P-type ATPase [Tieghemostelium lacteum]|uniref:Calcium-transporting ATPase n=1 Tax=Tieghemostelium lacteum TaxID=361077 RepID=A0A151ZH10_TIELA|nr:P-type ATPase [Tieghemostelium lacteum]|eukprot:KYQ93215.1 P-type ATPase [Tieghemostelium lacteum]